MSFRDYLIEQETIRLSALAFKMWPGNKYADTYLSKKLSGQLPFTDKDEKRARKALKELGAQLIDDSKTK